MAPSKHCGAMTEPGPDDLRNSFYRKTTRSSRRMTPLRRLLYKLAVPLGLGIIKSWLATCRVVRVVGVENLEAALAKAPSLVKHKKQEVDNIATGSVDE